MSREQFADDCPGCRPIILDIKTKRALPAEHPAMQAITAVWQSTTRFERECFHRFTCLNSRERLDVTVVDGLRQKMQDALKLRGL